MSISNGKSCGSYCPKHLEGFRLPVSTAQSNHNINCLSNQNFKYSTKLIFLVYQMSHYDCSVEWVGDMFYPYQI